MDPTLAEIYGTNQFDESDLEKLAAAELADGLADEDGIDLDGIDDDDLEALAQSVLETGDEEDGEEIDEVQQEKLAEADYLGRVMAHAYNQELVKIAAEAPKTTPGATAYKPTSFGEKAGNKARRGRAHVEHFGRKGVDAVGKHLKRHRGVYGAAAGAGAVGYGAHKAYKKIKESSALDTLAEQRAYEILDEAGLLKTAAEAPKTTPGATAYKPTSFGEKAGNKMRRGRAHVEHFGRKGVDRVGKHLKRHRGVYGVAAGAGAAGYGAHKAYKKIKESAAETPYDVLAEQVELRALQLLEENGYEFEDGDDE